MGNSASIEKAHEEQANAAAKFKDDLRTFLTNSLIRDSDPQHVLLLDQVVKRFANRYPDHQAYVAKDQFGHGFVMNHIVGSIQEEFDSDRCVMVCAK